MGQLPSVVSDNFESVGKSEVGAVHIRCVGWEYQAPRGEQKGEGQYRGEFDIFERPGQAGLEEKVWDSFFLDHRSLWKLRDLSMGMGINHGKNKVDWKDVAEECIGRTCWAYLDERKGKQDGKMYPDLKKFAPNLAAIESGKPQDATAPDAPRL